MVARAYHKLILPDGEIQKMAVVSFDDNGNYAGHHFLRGEEPFVEWVGGTLDLRKSPSFPSLKP